MFRIESQTLIFRKYVNTAQMIIRLLTLTAITTMLIVGPLGAQCFEQQTFETPGNTTFTIPGSNTETVMIEIEVKGADGAPYMLGGNPIFAGGEGALMKATFSVMGGDVLRIMVGEKGMRGGSPAGGGGGGGSAVIINDTEVLIAAAAGGGGGNATGLGGGGQANTDSSPTGGTGLGAPGGGGFNAPGADGQVGTGGGAGTLTAPGAGGMGGVVAGDGGMGFGGGGGGAGTGGGGGGGYQGGNGGVDGALGGLGGDSYINTGFSSAVIETTAGATGGSVEDDGYIIVKCTTGGGDPLDIEVVSQSDPSCLGGSDGSIEVSGLQGMPPYMYSIDGGSFQSSGLFEGLAAGTYTLTVMDNDGATASVDVTLNDAEDIQYDVAVTDNDCFGESGGEINVTVTSGGTAPFQFGIDGGPLQPDGQFTNLADGTYDLLILDANGCDKMFTATVSSPDQLNISVLSFEIPFL